ncbi:ubiquitin-conjugating enzyme E2, partial [Aureobasidium melanogenum]
MSLKRIAQEYTNLQSDPLEACSAAPANDDNLQQWNAMITGPEDTPYAQGTFRVNIHFPDNYPRSAPHVNFSTLTFHPNISVQGEVRLAELEELQWSPAFTIRTVLISLQAMLSDPNISGGCVLNEEAAKLYLEDHSVFKEKARQWTKSYANAKEKESHRGVDV